MSCGAKDVRRDGIYCTMGKRMGWRCSYFAESKIKLTWSKSIGKMMCQVFKDMGAFFAILIEGVPVCVSLYTPNVGDMETIHEVINPSLERALMHPGNEDADIIIEMLDNCKKTEV